MKLAALITLGLVAGCSAHSAREPPPGGDAEMTPPDEPAPESDTDAPPSDADPMPAPRLELGASQVSYTLASRERSLVVSLPAAAVLTVRAPGATLVLADQPETEPGFWGPRALAAGEHTLSVTGAGEVTLAFDLLGPALESVEEARSLVWRDAALVDAPAVVGLARLMSALSADGHGGRLLAAWLARFATTAHSERAGPALLLEALVAEHGADAGAWDLDALPFVVTAVHNRIDLRDGGGCGELRVSVACVAPDYQPFHLLFRFRQEAQAGDASPAGAVHCATTALRWALLSSASEEEYVGAARALLDEALVAARFIDAESVEFIISPWEWRQWDLTPNPDASTRDVLPLVFDNPPLFQTVDAARVNEAGAERDDFIAFVEANAAGLAARTTEVPARFRAPSARVNAGVPWRPLDLTGVSASTLAAYPSLRQQIEIVGCPACHATDAEFVQTRADRGFSPFYVKELRARAEYLIAVSRGAPARATFGPLQRDPLLPP